MDEVFIIASRIIFASALRLIRPKKIFCSRILCLCLLLRRQKGETLFSSYHAKIKAEITFRNVSICKQMKVTFMNTQESIGNIGALVEELVTSIILGKIHCVKER